MPAIPRGFHPAHRPLRGQTSAPPTHTRQLSTPPPPAGEAPPLPPPGEPPPVLPQAHTQQLPTPPHTTAPNAINSSPTPHQQPPHRTSPHHTAHATAYPRGIPPHITATPLHLAPAPSPSRPTAAASQQQRPQGAISTPASNPGFGPRHGGAEGGHAPPPMPLFPWIRPGMIQYIRTRARVTRIARPDVVGTPPRPRIYSGSASAKFF